MSSGLLRPSDRFVCTCRTPGMVASFQSGERRARAGGSARSKTITAAARAAAISAARIIERLSEFCRRSQSRGLVDALPRELRLAAAEVSEGGGLPVDRPSQIQLLHDSAR